MTDLPSKPVSRELSPGESSFHQMAVSVNRFEISIAITDSV